MAIMLYQRLKFAVFYVFRRRQAERELEEEIRTHLAIAERERRDRGETPCEAKQNARRELGNELLIKETTRDMWGWASLERLSQDMRYVLRQIKRSPVFTTTAVLTLALGLGCTTAMFSIVNGVLLQPLRFRDPSRLYLARTLPPQRSKLTGKQTPPLEVVGIVGEVRAAGLEQTSPTMMVYENYWRMKPIGMSIVVRTRADPAPLAAVIRSILSSADPEMAISQPRTMEQILDESVAPRKFEMDLAVGFAIAALALASLGIYGVVSFAVARRTPEIGIRIALGARGTQLVAMVMRRGMLPVFAGIAAGLVCALLIGRFLASQLFGVSPHDPATISTVVVVLMAVATCACWAPAHRAARVDPMRALRLE